MSEAVYQRVVEHKLGSPDSIEGNEHNYPCSFCTELGFSSHLHVNYEKAAAICHQCGYKTRTLSNLVRDLYGHLPKNILRLLDQARFSQDVRDILASRAEVTAHEPVELPKTFTRLPCKHKRIARKIREYVLGRGYSDDTMDRYGLGFVTRESHSAYGHVIFPFYMNGHVVYWQGRNTRSNGKKSCNPKGTGKKEILFGYDQASERKHAMIVEGPFDALAADAAGYGGLGLTLNSLNLIQARLIAAIGFRSHVVCLDGPKDDGSEDTWEQKIKDPSSGRKLPRPLVYSRMIAQATGARTGYLRLDKDDPDKNRERLARYAAHYTEWLAQDVRDSVRAIMGNRTSIVV